MASNPHAASEMPRSDSKRSEERYPASPEIGGAEHPRQSRSHLSWLSGRQWRHSTRWIGMAIFFLGVGLLVYVFLEALHGFQAFSQPDYLTRTLDTAAKPDKWMALGQNVASEFLRVLYLLLLGYLSAAIATKGIQFFSASEAVIDEAVAAGMDE